jgi:hypothetical protein
MLSLHSALKGKRNISLVVAAVSGDRIWLLGPDEQTAVVDKLTLDQGLRQLQSALATQAPAGEWSIGCSRPGIHGGWPRRP